MTIEYEAIKSRMAELKEERIKLLSLTDITGGQRGLRNNALLYRRAENIKKQIIGLNKKLLDCCGLNK